MSRYATGAIYNLMKLKQLESACKRNIQEINRKIILNDYIKAII